MNYHTYIGSAQWQAKRQERLEFDGHRCVICHHDGSLFSLSVHHLHYENLGNEDVQHDLLTACSKCHHRLDTIERFQRYNRRQHAPDIWDQPIPERIATYGMAESAIPTEITLPDDLPQRTDRKPIGPPRKSLETGIIEARKDRF